MEDPGASAEGGGEGGGLTIIFTVLPEGFQHSLSGASASAAVGAVREALGADLSLNPAAITLRLPDGTALEDDGVSLGELGVAADATQMELAAEVRGGMGEGGMAAGGEEPAGSGYVMPDEIEVEVDHGGGQPLQVIRVGIVRDERRKLYLGGYRHRKTGLVYHHAGSQTLPQRLDWHMNDHKNTRETQTAITATRTQQTTAEGGTQMARSDLLLDESADRQLSPRVYFTSDMLGELRLAQTVVIQCYWRGFVARTRAAAKRAEIAEQAAAAAAAGAAAVEAEEARRRAEVARRMHPRSAADFEILYNELEAWRAHETARINEAEYAERERLAALAQLLHKETKLLQTIDRLKITANNENRRSRINQMLGLMSAPKRWQMSDGEVAEVHTPFTTRAKELLELHRGLTLPELTVDERLDVLLHVKWTVKEFDCNLTREIVDLIDREADLLNRGRGEKTLEGLRKRVANLFLQFIETPEFNPEAARFSAVPRDLMLRQNVQPITSTQ